MSVLDVGRVCRKTQGRDAGELCVIIDKADKKVVLVDGKNVRRRKVSTSHLEPLPNKLKVGKNAKTDTVVNALSKEGLI